MFSCSGWWGWKNERRDKECLNMHSDTFLYWKIVLLAWNCEPLLVQLSSSLLTSHPIFFLYDLINTICYMKQTNMCETQWDATIQYRTKKGQQTTCSWIIKPFCFHLCAAYWVAEQTSYSLYIIKRSTSKTSPDW